MIGKKVSELFDELFESLEGEFHEEDELLQVANCLLVSILSLSSSQIAELPEEIKDLVIVLKQHVEEERCEYEEKDTGKYCIMCGDYISQRARYCSKCGAEQ